MMATGSAWPCLEHKPRCARLRSDEAERQWRKRKLGTSGIEVSVVGVGCNNFGRRIHDVAGARAVVHRALDLGITLFDTADVYGNGTSESFLGETLGKRRKQVVIATKFGWGKPERTRRGARSCGPSRQA